MSTTTGPGRPGRRHVERLVQDARQIVHVAHQPVVLGARPGDADRIAFLKSVVADQVRRHLAGDADERHRIHHRVGQRRHHVGRAGPRGDQRHARLAGRARVALRRVARALLVADEDVLDLLLLEKLVVDREDGAAGIAEDVLHVLVGERPYHHFGAGHLLWHGIHPFPSSLGRRCGFKATKKGPAGPLSAHHRSRQLHSCPGSAPRYDKLTLVHG